MGEVDRAAAAGEIVVESRIFRLQPVIGGVVDAAERQRRAHMVALRGVVIDHVEHHLDAGVVQPRHGGAEGVERIVLRVARLRREKRQRVVAPVIHQLLLDQRAVVDQSVDRQQLDGGDAEPLEMLDHGRRRQAAIGAAQIGRHVFALLRQALDVRFIDDGVFPGDVRPRLAASPVEGFVDDDGLGHAARIVAPVEREVLARAAGAIGEMRIAPHQPAGKALGVGIEQQLVGVEAMAVLGLIGPMNAIAVELSGRNVVQITVPDIFGAFGQFDALEFAASLASRTGKARPFAHWRKTAQSWCPGRPSLHRGVRTFRRTVACVSFPVREKWRPSGGMVRLSSGTRPSNVWTSPTFPTLLPP